MNHDFLVLDTDARVVGGPMGPLVVSWEEGRRLIDGGEVRGLSGTAIHARELASCDSWKASWGPVPEGGAAWKLVPRNGWRSA